MSELDKFLEELPVKLDALAETINAKLFEQLKGYYRLDCRYGSLAEYIKDNPYPPTH